MLFAVFEWTVSATPKDSESFHVNCKANHVVHFEQASSQTHPTLEETLTLYLKAKWRTIS